MPNEVLTEIHYKHYIITYFCKPIPDRNFDYDFRHDDYDGEGDDRHGSCGSVDLCKKAIDEKISEATTFCPECKEEDFIVQITDSGSGFNGDYVEHWFQGDGECGSCGYKGQYSDSN